MLANWNNRIIKGSVHLNKNLCSKIPNKKPCIVNWNNRVYIEGLVPLGGGSTCKKAGKKEEVSKHF